MNEAVGDRRSTADANRRAVAAALLYSSSLFAIGYLLRELLFDEDTLAIFSLGLVPFLSGLLSLVSKLRSSRVSEREVALGNGVEK